MKLKFPDLKREAVPKILLSLAVLHCLDYKEHCSAHLYMVLEILHLHVLVASTLLTGLRLPDNHF